MELNAINKTLKKLALSGFVILAFIAYSFQSRREGTASIITPTSSSGSAQNTQKNQPSSTNSPSRYKDGTYTGDVADAYYGNIQVQVTIQSGKITDVKFLQYPNDRANSIYINQQAMPYLRQEAIQAQNARVDTVTGASETSAAFVESLSSALARAS